MIIQLLPTIDADNMGNEVVDKSPKKKKSKKSIKEKDCVDGYDRKKKSKKESKKKKKEKKKKKKSREKRKHDISANKEFMSTIDDSTKSKKRRRKHDEEEDTKNYPNTTNQKGNHFPFEYQHIVAPMVGASELAFRLLCRKYGATLAYTPMMSSSQFIKEAAENTSLQNGDTNAITTIANSNICEFQTIPQDRPLVVHFSANDPHEFAQAAKLVEHNCDAIDLNLGCPQRTAYLGHFGSYLLGEDDRQLILDIVKAGKDAVSIPIFVKIRLLNTIEDTIKLCHQLRDAGASLIAIHARYRASWERTSAGARDGPALLDQVATIKQSMGDFPIISNGNVRTYEDVITNKKLTGADGIMSAEGILNNPALYLPRLGDVKKDGECEVQIPIPSPLHTNNANCITDEKKGKAIRKLEKKLRKIESIEKKVKEFGDQSINDDQRSKLQTKAKIQLKLKSELEKLKASQPCKSESSEVAAEPQTTTVKLSELYKAANNKLCLAKEYISLVRSYPMKIRSVVFHTRRMCKDLLEQYQLMEECIAATTVDEVEAVICKCEGYIKHPESFHYDQEKAKREKEAMEKKRAEEGKRKAYEGRMTRKAKREGLADLEHYLRIGAEVPTVEIIKKLKKLPKEERLGIWKKNHSQHCMSYHLEEGGCKRDRACAFLHSEAKDASKFDEGDEVAG